LNETIFGYNNATELPIFALSTLSGYFLIYSFNTWKPLLSYKMRFGGINTFTFNSNCDRIAISGQDDSVSIIDLRSMSNFKLEGHKSFVSKTVIHTLSDPAMKAGTENFNRMITASMDGYIGFWEFRSPESPKNPKLSLPFKFKETRL